MVKQRIIITTVALLVIYLTCCTGAVEITVGLRVDSEADTAWIGQMITEFERLYPDIKVKHDHLVWPWIERITTMMATGDAPDVIEMWGDFALDWAQSGGLMDLNPFVQRDFTAADVKDFFPGQWSASVVPGGRNAGVRYGIPKYTNVQLQLYNTDHFLESELELPNRQWDRGNWIWSTFLESAKRLTRVEANGNVTRWGYKPRMEGRWPIWVWGAGGEVLGWPANPTAFRLDQPQAIEGLEFLRSLIHDYQVAPREQWGDDFATGKFGIGDGWGSCCIADVQKTVKQAFAWNIVPVPRGPQAHVPILFNDMWGMYAKTPNPEAAWRFIKFASSTRGGELVAMYRRQQPARRSALLAYAKALEDIDVSYTLQSAAVALPSTAVALDNKRAAEVLDAMALDIVYGNKPARIAVQEVAPVVRGILESH